MARRDRSSFRQTLIGTLQTLFAITLFAIFAIAWAVQTGTIDLPQWAKAWNNATPQEVDTYTAALVPSVCILAAIFFIAGFILMRRERTLNNNSMV